jgi:hypothetical protein
VVTTGIDVAGMAQWIEWTRTQLMPPEVEIEPSRLSNFERARLEDHHWVSMPGRVLWLDPNGALRRARFTHGTHFRTAKGEFYADSAGRVHLVSDMKAASPPRTSSGCEDDSSSSGPRRR